MSQSKTINYSKAYWLVRHTKLTFEQIAEFCDLLLLEVVAIEEGTSKMCGAAYDLIQHGELTKEEIERCEADTKAKLTRKKLLIDKDAIKRPRARAKKKDILV